ncbi:MAG: serine/threonine protein kinase, partial [Xanthomonadales bacterium]|nr:serine/threonine protein kinase [Xanthomonadales bacterium]
MTTSFPTIPGYRIERLLGTGGMAAVWLAVQENLGRPVALKVMANTLCLDDHFRARFLNEARIVAQLRHPNILSIHDSGSTADGQLYMVTDFLDGGTLKERIGSGMSAAKALRIIAALADALMVAHEQRIWHRDVKPDNVLFDRKENFVLADFGIAKSDGEQAANLTGTGNIVGTPRYMSPEQFQCQPVDLRSDIYSLGVMLFEMLTGEVPYADVNTYALALKHIQAPVPNLPVALSRLQPLLSRMLAKAPMDRFPDCAALAAAVQDALDDVCAPSRAALPPPRVVTPARRSRTFLTGMSVFAAVGVIAWLLVSRDAPEPAPPVASTARVDPARAPDGGPDA